MFMTGDEVRMARHELGMTQHELAAALELSNADSATIRRWEHNSRPISGPARVAIRLMLALRRAGIDFHIEAPQPDRRKTRWPRRNEEDLTDA